MNHAHKDATEHLSRAQADIRDGDIFSAAEHIFKAIENVAETLDEDAKEAFYGTFDPRRI